MSYYPFSSRICVGNLCTATNSDEEKLDFA